MAHETIGTREMILNAPDHKTDKVEVPEWGCTVFVRSMSGGERDWLLAQLSRESAEGGERYTDISSKLVSMCTIDGAGNRLFSEEDVAALAQKDVAPLDRVLKVISRLNGLGGNAIEDMEKN